MSIQLRDVSLRVGADTHIHNTNLSLQAGEFNILLGTTLSGKTSLMRLMAGLEKPTSGEVLADSNDVTGVAVQKRSVAMVYQAFINYPSFSVYDNIASPLRVAGMAKDEIDANVRRFSDLLKLTPMLNRLPSELSGGQQQRTALARALIKGADLVLLDEPLANLDYKLREELRDELPKLFADTGATVVYATSEPLEALMLGGYTATLHEGRVIQFGKTSEIYRHPQSLQGAKVFSDPPVNTALVEKRGDHVFLSESVSWQTPEQLVSKADGEYKIGLRPYHLLPGNVDTGQRVEVGGEVQIAEISGSESIVRVEIEGNHWVSEAHGIHSYQYGETAKFNFDADKCMYFDPEDQLIQM